MLLVNQLLVQKMSKYWFKTKAMAALSLHHMYDSTNCAASAWFLNQYLYFFEQVLCLEVSIETGESAHPRTAAVTDQLTTQL